MNVQGNSVKQTELLEYNNGVASNSIISSIAKIEGHLLKSTGVIGDQTLRITQLNDDLECATDLNRKNIKIISKYEQEINEYRSLTEKLAQICVNQGTISLDSKETGLDRLRAIVKELSEKDTTPESK